jgi:hypothetical protein
MEGIMNGTHCKNLRENRAPKVLPDVRKLFGSEHLHILLIDCSDHFARVLCDELSPLPVDVKHMGSLSDSKEDKSESSSIDVNDDGGRYAEKNYALSALSALMSESDGRMRSLLSSRQWEEWSGVCRAVIVDESTLKMKGFDLEEVLDKLVVLFPRLLLLTTTATTGILVERRMRKPELREAFLSLVRITFAKDISLRKPVVREALLTLVPMVCAKGIHVAVVDTVILVQVNETSSAQMVTTSETSLPISAELIGRRFLFGLIFSGGDVGKHILTFIPGKKGKEWEDGNEAACSGHLHLVKWLWEKGIRSDHRGAESAAGNGHLVTLKWLHKQDIWCTTRGADDAAVYGDLVILKWLDKQDIRCSFLGANYAAEGGHLETLKWLHEQHEDYITSHTTAYAASGGHFEILKWIHQQGIRCDAYTAHSAVRRGHMEILKWLHQQNIKCDAKDANTAACFGHFEILQWLHQQDIRCNAEGANDAARHGHLEVLQWLFEEGIWCDVDGARYAARRGWMQVLELLHEQEIRLDTANDAAFGGQWETL